MSFAFRYSVVSSVFVCVFNQSKQRRTKPSRPKLRGKNRPAHHGSSETSRTWKSQPSKQMESFNIFMSIKSLTHVCFPEDNEEDESIIKSNQIRDLRDCQGIFAYSMKSFLCVFAIWQEATHERTNLSTLNR